MSSSAIERVDLPIPGVYVLRPRVFSDPRGFFVETYNAKKFHEVGVEDVFLQDNHSRSVVNTIRGLHYQLRHPQAKLCRVVAGKVLDVVVDIRVGSPTFGRWASVVLCAEEKNQIYIPFGIAHGFAVLSPDTEFLYKCSDYYHPEDEHGILWNDPDINISWPVLEPLLSTKDQAYPCLKDIAAECLPQYGRKASVAAKASMDWRQSPANV